MSATREGRTDVSDTLAQLEEDRKALLPWLWVASVAVMLASLISGTELMMSLGTHIFLALLFPISADVGLIATLRGSGRLARHGLRTGATAALRWTSFLMSLALNCTGSVIKGDLLAATFHGFMPVLMIVLAFYEDRFNALISGEIVRLRSAVDEQARLAALAERQEEKEAEFRKLYAEAEPVAEPEPIPTKGRFVVARTPETQQRKRVVKSDDVVKAEIRELIEKAPDGRVTTREVVTACSVSPNRAGPLLKTVRAELETDSGQNQTAYL